MGEKPKIKNKLKIKKGRGFRRAFYDQFFILILRR